MGLIYFFIGLGILKKIKNNLSALEIYLNLLSNSSSLKTERIHFPSGV